MRRTILALLLTALLLGAAPARAESPRLTCRENRAGCLLLQAVTAGEFSHMDVSDSLDVRVHAAVYPLLLTLTEEDVAHYLAEYPMDEEVFRRHLYAAMGHGLWADILTQPAGDDERLNNSRQVLLLFLRPALGRQDIEDRAVIRSMLTDELLAEIAVMNGVSPAFLEHLFYSDDWRDTESAP